MDATDSKLSRRNMVLGLGGTAAILGVASVTAAPLRLARSAPGAGPSLWDRQYWTLESAGQAEWTRQVGSAFSLGADNGVKAMRLLSVAPLPAGGARPRTLGRDAAFIATFDAPGAAVRPDGLTYAVNHRKYGAMKMFLAPGGGYGRLIAIFN